MPPSPCRDNRSAELPDRSVQDRPGPGIDPDAEPQALAVGGLLAGHPALVFDRAGRGAIELHTGSGVRAGRCLPVGLAGPGERRAREDQHGRKREDCLVHLAYLRLIRTCTTLRKNMLISTEFKPIRTCTN